MRTVSNKRYTFLGYTYGEVILSKKAGRYTWGFPGSPTVHRPKTVPNWMVFWDENEYLTDHFTVLTIKKNGELNEEAKSQRVLQYNDAAILNYAPGKGKWEFIKLPILPNPGLLWRKPTAYKRIESRVALTRGQTTRRGTTPAGSTLVQTVKGYANVSADSDPLLKKYWNGYQNRPHALEQIARGRVMKVVRDADLDLSIALGEIRKTADMIAKNALEVMAFYKAFRKGDFNGIWSRIKQPGKSKKQTRKEFYSLTASERWLEYAYGWTPLVSDIKGLIDWANKDMPVQGTFRVTATSFERISESLTPGGSSKHIHSYIIGKRGCKIVLHYTIDSAGAVYLSNLGLNPLMTAWDLLPWSFVVDWFFTIGTALEYLDASVGKTFISGSITHFGEFTTESIHDVYKPWRVSEYNSVLLNRTPSKAVYKSMYTERFPLTSWPYPMPYIKNPLSTPHVINAIALMRTNIRQSR